MGEISGDLGTAGLFAALRIGNDEQKRDITSGGRRPVCLSHGEVLYSIWQRQKLQCDTANALGARAYQLPTPLAAKDRHGRRMHVGAQTCKPTSFLFFPPSLSLIQHRCLAPVSSWLQQLPFQHRYLRLLFASASPFAQRPSRAETRVRRRPPPRAPFPASVLSSTGVVSGSLQTDPSPSLPFQLPTPCCSAKATFFLPSPLAAAEAAPSRTLTLTLPSCEREGQASQSVPQSDAACSPGNRMRGAGPTAREHRAVLCCFEKKKKRLIGGLRGGQRGGKGR